MRVRLSPSAKADLAAIKSYISEDNPAAAARLIRLIRRRLNDSIAAFPVMGEPCDQLASALRRVVVGNYVIFYSVGASVEVARVLHGARDIDALFE